MENKFLTLTELSKSVKGIDLDNPLSEQSKSALRNLVQRVDEMSRQESKTGDRDQTNKKFSSYLLQDFRKHLNENGIQSGNIAEIGGRLNSFASYMPEFDFTFLSLYPGKNDDQMVVADITQCDYIPDNSFDAVYSKSVLEHVSRPWLAGKNIERILKPGGIAYHSVPFSYFYHGAPEDYWRFTPVAFEMIFPELEPVHGQFYGESRRYDNVGSPTNSVDSDGGELFSLDSFGGWRENWSSIFVGRKNPDWLADKKNKAQMQIVIDIVKGLTLLGDSEDEAIVKTTSIIDRVDTDRETDIRFVKPGNGINFNEQKVREIWSRRGHLKLKPSYARFRLPYILGLANQ